MTAKLSGPATIPAIVPMRYDSEREPGKNYHLFNGKPLYHYSIESLPACSRVNTIVIGIDSPVIMNEVSRKFPTIKIIERSVHLRLINSKGKVHDL